MRQRLERRRRDDRIARCGDRVRAHIVGEQEEEVRLGGSMGRDGEQAQQGHEAKEEAEWQGRDLGPQTAGDTSRSHPSPILIFSLAPNGGAGG